MGKTPSSSGSFVKTCSLPSGYNYSNTYAIGLMIKRPDNGLYQYVTGEMSLWLATDNYIYAYANSSYWCGCVFKAVLIK